MVTSGGPTECFSCGGTVAPDGHCWDCGEHQPAFRSHLEITADGGAAGISDRGLRRQLNADAMALTRAGEWTIGVACDGVSMSPRAERAAQVAADTASAVLAGRLRAGTLPEAALPEAALPEAALSEAAERAGRAVAALADSKHSAPSCTYVSGIVAPGGGIWTCWVGDSRAYWLPDVLDEGPGMALTDDDTGEHDALTAWLGADAGDPEPRLRSYRPPGPGRLLLCTDGLWRYLPDAESLQAELRMGRPVGRRPDRRAPSPQTGPDNLLGDARSLVNHALNAGGHDNITALLIPVR